MRARSNTLLTPLAVAVVFLGVLGFAPEAEAQWVREDTKFEKVEDVAGRKLLFTKDGKTYSMSETVYKRASRIIPFLKNGSKIHIWYKGERLGKLEKGWKVTNRLTAKQRELVDKLEPGSRIRINGKTNYEFERKSSVALVVKKEAAPGVYIERDVVAFKDIKSIELIVEEAQDDDPDNLDVFDTFHVKIGDTVELSLEDQSTRKGVVTKLSNINCELKTWSGGAYQDVVTIQRRKVTKVVHKPVDLRRVHTIDSEDGEASGSLSVEVERLVHSQAGRMTFDVTLTLGEVDRALIPGFELVFEYSQKVDGLEQPDATGVERVIPLFPGRPFKITHTAISDVYKDGQIRLPELKVVPYSHPDAAPYVLRALDTERNEDTLRSLYVGMAEGGDELFVRFLITRTLIPLIGKAGGELHGSIAQEALLITRAAGAKVILDELFKPDDKLGVVLMADGKLIEEPLPDKEGPAAWRGKLLSMLSNQQNALSEGGAERLFAFYAKNNAFTGEVERVFSKHASDTVTELMEIAVPQGERAASTDKRDSELAATVIRNLGEQSLDALRAVLVAREVATDDFDEARQKNADQPFKAIDAGFAVAQKAAYAARKEALDNRIKEANALRKQGEFKDALEIVREVLAIAPKLPSANKIFPLIAVPYAQKRKDGKAALLLEEAVERKSQKARAALAELLLRGVTEDLHQVIVRDAPTLGGVSVRDPVQAGEEFNGELVEKTWVRVRYTQSKEGYIRRDCLTKRGDVYLPEARGCPPFQTLEKQLERIRELDPSLEDAVNKQLGKLNAREFTWLYEQDRIDESLAYLEVAQEYAPEDVNDAFGAWWQANKSFVGLLFLVGIAFAGMGFVVFKRLKAELVAEEDLSGQDLEIVLEYGVEKWDDEQDEDEDDVFSGGGGTAAEAAEVAAQVAAAPGAEGAPETESGVHKVPGGFSFGSS